MSRVQLALNVADLDESIAFYTPSSLTRRSSGVRRPPTVAASPSPSPPAQRRTGAAAEPPPDPDVAALDLGRTAD